METCYDCAVVWMSKKSLAESRIGEEASNNQGCTMKIVEYNNSQDLVVEFQDEYKIRVHTRYDRFVSGNVRNPYHRALYRVGIVGNKYPASANSKDTKEYKAWSHILERCYSEKYRKKQSTYNNVSVCNEWLLYDNFYEWIHSQSNFNAWHNGKRWGLDKDIIVKNNKTYSPETCCLVPQNVNNLFTKNNAIRGSAVIGVHKHGNKYLAFCNNPFTKEQEYLGSYDTEHEAFAVYKEHKESYIKQIAQEEYDKGNIIEECYNAMMRYEVEITD